MFGPPDREGKRENQKTRVGAGEDTQEGWIEIGTDCTHTLLLNTDGMLCTALGPGDQQ